MGIFLASKFSKNVNCLLPSENVFISYSSVPRLFLLSGLLNKINITYEHKSPRHIFTGGTDLGQQRDLG